MPAQLQNAEACRVASASKVRFEFGNAALCLAEPLCQATGFGARRRPGVAFFLGGVFFCFSHVLQVAPLALKNMAALQPQQAKFELIGVNLPCLQRCQDAAAGQRQDKYFSRRCCLLRAVDMLDRLDQPREALLKQALEEAKMRWFQCFWLSKRSDADGFDTHCQVRKHNLQLKSQAALACVACREA